MLKLLLFAANDFTCLATAYFFIPIYHFVAEGLIRCHMIILGHQKTSIMFQAGQIVIHSIQAQRTICALIILYK